MKGQTGTILVTLGAIVIATGPARAQAPERSVQARRLLTEAIATTVRHVIEQDDGWVVVTSETFPNSEEARAAASSMGLRFELNREDAVRCSDDRKDCGVLTLQDLAAPRGDVLLNVILRVMTSTQVERAGGNARLFGALREITLRAINGVWIVTGDQVIFRT